MAEYQPQPLFCHVDRSGDISKYFGAEQAHHDRNSKRFLHSGRNDKKESLRNDRFFLNFVGVLRELIPEYAGKIEIVQDDHVGIVFFLVVILPAFIPPAETDDRRPAARKKIFERRS